MGLEYIRTRKAFQLGMKVARKEITDEAKLGKVIEAYLKLESLLEDSDGKGKESRDTK